MTEIVEGGKHGPVERGMFESKNGRSIALDYHSKLLVIKPGDKVQIKMYTAMPQNVSDSTYLVQGLVYETGDGSFEFSAYGLLLLYKGDTPKEIQMDMKMYVEVEKSIAI